MTTAWVHIEMSSMLNRLHRLHVTAILAVLLPLLLFPELLFFNQSIFFMDLAWYHYPLRAYIADAWRAGTLPLWNPYSWNGFPLLAEYEVGALGPVNALFLLPIPTYQSLNLLLLSHIAIAGAGAYALARVVGVSRYSALIASLTFSCGGYAMAQYVRLNILIGSAYVPLILALLLRANATNRVRYSIAAGVVFALQILSSQPQVPYFTLILIGVFTLYALIQRMQSLAVRNWSTLFLVIFYSAIICLIGLGLSAPQWVSSLELLALSRRAQGLSVDSQLLLSMPPTSVLTLFFPRLFLLSTSSWRGTGVYDEFHYYLGLIPLVCLALAWLRRRELIIRFALIVLCVSLILALGRFTPAYELTSYLPLMSSFRVPAIHSNDQTLNELRAC